MDMFSYMCVTNTYDQVYVYIILNESLYNLASHKKNLLIFTSMYVTNVYI